MPFVTVPEQHPGQSTPSAVVPTTAQLRAVLDLPLHLFMALRRISQTLLVMRFLSKEEIHHGWSSLVMSCPLCFASPLARKQSINTRGCCFPLRHYLTISQWYQILPAYLGLPEEQKTKLSWCLRYLFQFVCWSYCSYNILQYLRFFARCLSYICFSVRMDFQII